MSYLLVVIIAIIAIVLVQKVGPLLSVSTGLVAFFGVMIGLIAGILFQIF